MNVFFRVDASAYIGSGHVMRCLSLAEMLSKCGCYVVFVMRSQPGDLCSYAESRGFKVERLHRPFNVTIPKGSADYQAWLQVDIVTDAENFLGVSANADIVVIDHYGINAKWETIIRCHLSCKLVVIDDLVREHRADLIIDQTVGRSGAEYKLASADSQVLAGSRYALLKGQFIDMHLLALEKKIDKGNHRLLLSMGGVDSPNATLAVLEALSLRDTAIQTTVLLNESAPHFEPVSVFCQLHTDWITHIPFSEDMASLMSRHTIAIGAPGATSWERACIGLPTLMVPIANNQRQICQNLLKEGAALSLSLFEIPTLLNTRLDILLTNFDKMRSDSLKLCDGKGSGRVVDWMRTLGWL